MIECYFKWCPRHQKDEPFCKLTYCEASKSDVKKYKILRREELKVRKMTDRVEMTLYD